MLEKRQFLIANNEPTVIDIIFYSEISTALYLLRLKGFQKRYPRVQAWIKLMSEVEGLLALDEKLVEMIEKYELEWVTKSKERKVGVKKHEDLVVSLGKITKLITKTTVVCHLIAFLGQSMGESVYLII